MLCKTTSGYSQTTEFKSVTASVGHDNPPLGRRPRALNFPKPIRIRGRKYRVEAELDAFDERQRAHTSLGEVA